MAGRGWRGGGGGGGGAFMIKTSFGISRGCVKVVKICSFHAVLL
jgi:hypothetical protein